MDKVALEVLKMAKDIVTNEYIDLRAQDHNKWLAQSEHLWRTQKIRLPYPAFPPYPNEDTIVKRAQVLMNFLQESGISNKSCEEEKESEKEEYEVEVFSDKSQDEISDQFGNDAGSTLKSEDLVVVDHKLTIDDFAEIKDKTSYLAEEDQNSTMPKRFTGMRQKLEDVKKSWF